MMHWKERVALEAEYERGLLDAARAVDKQLTLIGALEGSSIHSAMMGAVHEILKLRKPSGDGTKEGA